MTENVNRKLPKLENEENKRAEHKERHVMLHGAIDELVADFIVHTRRRPSETTVMELMTWASEQRSNPTEIESEDNDNDSES